MCPKVLVTRLLPPQTQVRLLEQDFELIQWEKNTAIPRKVLLEKIKGVDALYCLLTETIDQELLDAAGPQLKVIATMSVGYDHIDIEAVRSREIKLGNTPDVLTDATADLTVLLALGASRRIKEGIDAAQNGGWGEWSPTWLCGSQFTNKTLGVVGLGRIGEAVAKRLKAFGIARVVYSGRGSRPEAEKRTGAEFVSFDTLLQESDIITVCCALTKDTKNLFDYSAFTRMKKTVVFVNSAHDLVRALKEGLVGSVGLDVTTPEPLPPTHELYGFPNCLILPHVGSATMETRENMANMALDNIIAGLQGKELPYFIP
ncbi:D-isomer specific 2-hydroxyacid dehydrogenase [Blakeslea trispora]|nr:D-isomer specific 2-hydroxyacid dehydrogenase [Blakeslea trispora]